MFYNLLDIRYKHFKVLIQEHNEYIENRGALCFTEVF